jgi:hypothetical protein
VDRPAANETIITIVRNGGSENKAEEEAIRALSPAFIILAARTKIEQLTKHAIVLVGGWWVSKLDKKGQKKRNGNFNFTAAGTVSHDVTSQRLVLLDLSVFFYLAFDDPLSSCTS